MFHKNTATASFWFLLTFHTMCFCSNSKFSHLRLFYFHLYDYAFRDCWFACCINLRTGSRFAHQKHWLAKPTFRTRYRAKVSDGVSCVPDNPYTENKNRKATLDTFQFIARGFLLSFPISQHQKFRPVKYITWPHRSFSATIYIGQRLCQFFLLEDNISSKLNFVRARSLMTFDIG